MHWHKHRGTMELFHMEERERVSSNLPDLHFSVYTESHNTVNLQVLCKTIRDVRMWQLPQI